MKSLFPAHDKVFINHSGLGKETVRKIRRNLQVAADMLPSA